MIQSIQFRVACALMGGSREGRLLRQMMLKGRINDIVLAEHIEVFQDTDGAVIATGQHTRRRQPVRPCENADPRVVEHRVV